MGRYTFGQHMHRYKQSVPDPPSKNLPGTPSPRGRFDATVVLNEVICREHYRIRLSLPRDVFPPTRPGQFVQLGCRAPDAAISDQMLGREIDWQPGKACTVTQPELCEPLALLRRPFSLSARGEDAVGTWIDMIHRVVGVGTHWLAERKPADVVDLIGPLGNHFELPDGKSYALLVGGGVGIPPMIYLAQELSKRHCEIIAFIGARNAALLPLTFRLGQSPDPSGRPTCCAEPFANFGVPVVVTTDDGSIGVKGVVSEALDVHLSLSRIDPERVVVFCCGPDPMMRAVSTLAIERGVTCQVCLEQAMACGMGTCQSCVVKLRNGKAPSDRAAGADWHFRLDCTDGPVFRADQVIWD